MPSTKTYTYKDQTFASEQEMILYLLDEYRCVEGFAAQYLGAWKAVSQMPCVTGGLRTVCGREQLHAELLEARLCELGGTPQCEVPQERLAELAYYGSQEYSDLAKLEKVAVRLKDPEKILAFLTDAIAQIEDDEDTRELLSTILDDERASLQWITSSWALLQPQAATS